MGVPKFYRWTSERYPCLSEVVQENQIPEFDNLYLDMNGIIHTCSHPNDDDPHFRISEEQIFKDIFSYIEFLFSIIQPQKVFFMAIDGVAPRAKMNQQRGRRFKSAKAAMMLEKKAREKGEDLPTEARFDSNCITPGTVFMNRLQEQLKYFVTLKISNDPTWQGIKIYLSGHETPGEGEHKIMEFIRHSRSCDAYDPNTRHCLYGLDADLIMLGMCSHEPHFALLREEVKFIKPRRQQQAARTVNADRQTFHLLHLSLLREYLDFEFASVKEKITFPYEIERVIDDWVLMGFLVGNDFLPHLPQLHIALDAMPVLYKTYCAVLPKIDGYLNENGYLNLKRFEVFMAELAKFDRDKFSEENADLSYFAAKRTDNAWKPSSNNAGASGATQKRRFSGLRDLTTFEDFDEDLPAALKDVELEEALGEGCFREKRRKDDVNGEEEEDDTIANVLRDDDEDESESENSWTSSMEMEFKMHKRNYYREKMAYESITKDELHDQAVHYITAIQWNLHYYYHGVCSWSWYYPHHYAPYLSDVKNFAGVKFEFELGEPFLPFEQLLAVLPAASRTLLPSAYRDLMISASSPVIDYYPADFKEDLNGKQHEWEAVVLIPFIAEDRLLEAMKPLESRMTREERARNRHSEHLLYETAERRLAPYKTTLPGVFCDIFNNIAKCTLIPADAFRVERERVRHGVLPGAIVDLYFPGFPTFRHIPHTVELKYVGVQVFQMPTKNHSYLVKVGPRAGFDDMDLSKLAEKLCGKEVYTKWPYLKAAFVISVSNEREQFLLNEELGVVQRVPLTGEEEAEWFKDAKRLKEEYYSRRAVDVGEVNVLVYARPLKSKRVQDFHGQSRVTLQWAHYATPYIMQVVVEKSSVFHPKRKQREVRSVQRQNQETAPRFRNEDRRSQDRPQVGGKTKNGNGRAKTENHLQRLGFGQAPAAPVTVQRREELPRDLQRLGLVGRPDAFARPITLNDRFNEAANGRQREEDGSGQSRVEFWDRLSTSNKPARPQQREQTVTTDFERLLAGIKAQPPPSNAPAASMLPLPPSPPRKRSPSEEHPSRENGELPRTAEEEASKDFARLIDALKAQPPVAGAATGQPVVAPFPPAVLPNATRFAPPPPVQSVTSPGESNDPSHLASLFARINVAPPSANVVLVQPPQAFYTAPRFPMPTMMPPLPGFMLPAPMYPIPPNFAQMRPRAPRPVGHQRSVTDFVPTSVVRRSVPPSVHADAAPVVRETAAAAGSADALQQAAVSGDDDGQQPVVREHRQQANRVKRGGEGSKKQKQRLAARFAAT